MGGRGKGGGVQIACSGVELNECSTQLVATVIGERPPQPTVHRAIIQACFNLSSRVLLVSGVWGGGVQIAFLGGELNECSTQLVATSLVGDGVLGWLG